MDQAADKQEQIENQKNQYKYLSFEVIETQIEQGQEEGNVQSGKFSYFNYVKLFIQSIYEIIFLIMIVWPIVFLLVPFTLIGTQNATTKILMCIWLEVSLASINYTVINFCFARENMLFAVEQILKDTIFFIITALIVTIFLRVNSQKESPSFSYFLVDKKLMSTFLYNFNLADQDGYFLDYQSQQLNGNDLPAPSKNFTKFNSTQKVEINHLIYQFYITLKINIQMFALLSSVIILKLFMVFYYLYCHSQMEVSTKNIFDLSVSIFTYLYITFILCRTLGNFDLIRKINTFKQLNDYIDFNQSDLLKNGNFKKKLDILSATSLESWDSARKLILTHQQEELITLELTYLGLIFYYLFVITICLSSFYELYWIIPKESPLLSDTIVIMSLFNFIFLSLFFMYRFQKGTEFNECFDELQLTVQDLLDVMSDLSTQYNDYFLQDIESENKVQKNSIYGLLIIKIKQMSYEYIINNQQYLGEYYTLEQKEILRKQIIINTKTCLEKLSKSIQTDQQKYSYKFLNVFDIQFNEFLTTVLVITITSLPQIIPKFIDFYKK